MSDRRFLFLLFVVIVLVIPAVMAGAEVQVRFPDAALESAVRGALREWDKELTSTDLARLTTLDAQNKNISDLHGLEFATNLKKLNLTGNQISNITPLAGLTRLEHLTLKWNRISDISPLQNLQGLTYLSLENNEVADLSVLAGLTGLKRLNLGKNGVRDLTPLQSLTGLEQLVLYYNEISDISALANLTNLQVLNLSDNEITDIKPLQASLERGNLQDAFINLANNPLTQLADSATASQLNDLTNGYIDVGESPRPAGGQGVLEPAVEVKRPRGVPPKPEGTEEPDDVRVEPERPHTEQGSLDMRLMQFMLVLTVILAAAIIYVGYRIIMLLMRQRSTPM